MATTVLIVDSDLGFVFWLGQALDSSGYLAVPARDTRSALELIREQKIRVDILVIDPLLPNAISLISILRQAGGTLITVGAVPPDWAVGPSEPEFDVVARKPERLTAAALLSWLNLIRSFFTPSAGDGRIGRPKSI